MPMLPLLLLHTCTQVKNGCMPATGSGFANMCLDHMVLPDSDLVLVEFATNDFLRVGACP
jgi:hypothetical protein